MNWYLSISRMLRAPPFSSHTEARIWEKVLPALSSAVRVSMVPWMMNIFSWSSGLIVPLSLRNENEFNLFRKAWLTGGLYSEEIYILPYWASCSSLGSSLSSWPSAWGAQALCDGLRTTCLHIRFQGHILPQAPRLPGLSLQYPCPSPRDWSCKSHGLI